MAHTVMIVQQLIFRGAAGPIEAEGRRTQKGWEKQTRGQGHPGLVRHIFVAIGVERCIVPLQLEHRLSGPSESAK